MKKMFFAVALSVGALVGANAATLTNHDTPLTAHLGSAFLPASSSYDFTYVDGGTAIFKFVFDNPNDDNTSITLTQGGSTIFENIVLSIGQSFSYVLSAGDYSLKLGEGTSANLDTFQISAVPLPGAALLFGSALLGAGAVRRRKKNISAAAA